MSFFKALAISFLITSIACAQDIEGGEPTIEAPESDVFFSGIDISIDVSKLAFLATDFEDKYEASAGIFLFNRLGLTYEYGYGNLEPRQAIPNGTYQSEGTYYRVGMDVYFNIDPKNRIFLGGRFAESSFDDNGTFEITGQLEDDFNGSFSRSGLEANWIEFIIGSEQEIYRNLFLGFKFRLRVLGSTDNFEPIEVYTIPGYGRTFDDTVPAMNFHLKYRFKPRS
ncbi:MAG: DUF6048 family protein [Bacteroidota bacterium]